MNALPSYRTFHLIKDENGERIIAEFTEYPPDVQPVTAAMSLSFSRTSKGRWERERIKGFDPGCLPWLFEDQHGYRMMDKELAKRLWDLLRKDGWWMLP